MAELVTYAVSDGIAQVRLNRPDKLNALTLETLEQLEATARALRGDRTLRAVVISGEGASFCAGLDFASVLGKRAGIVRAFVPRPWRGTNLFQEACWAWRRLPVPVIAAVHGHCFGGGIQIALAADFRFATPDSEWAVLEGRWGLIPDMSGIQSLKELVGIDTAKRLTMTAQTVTGKEAAELGLVTELAADPVAAATRVRPRARDPLPRRAGGSQAAVQPLVERRLPRHLRARADRAAVPAHRRQHQDRPRGRLQEARAVVRPPRTPLGRRTCRTFGGSALACSA